MSTLSPKNEMIQLVQQCISGKNFSTAAECLKVYKRSFGEDNFFHSCNIAITPVTAIYILSEAEKIPDLTQTISTDFHANLSIRYIHEKNLIEEFSSCLSSIDTDYLCFYDSRHHYEKNRIAVLLSMTDKFPSVNGIIHGRNFIDNNGTVIAHPDYIYKETLDNNLFNGKDLLHYSAVNNVNLYGDLSNIFLSTAYVKQLSFSRLEVAESMQPLALLYQLLLPAKIAYTYLPLSSSIVTPYSDATQLMSDYIDFLRLYHSKNDISHISEVLTDFTTTEHFVSCKKEITFFYTDMGEYHNLKPLADAVASRGYKTTFTTDIHRHAEIGVYCQHICYPENSKFSLILLHDLAQGHNRWPAFWELERWDKYDIGIIPGQSWANLWTICAFQYYANPRCGAYELGYPKSSLIFSHDLSEHVRSLKEQLHLKYDFSILYAPSWENDGKEDDFIKALSSLKVNLLIKQAHWNEKYSDIIQNIKDMRQSHEGKFDNVYYIEPKESIMTALAMCNLVVSDESSVMAEALMFDVPSIAVTDWLIPDTTPSRFSSVPMDYVIKCQKSNLRDCVERYLHSPEDYRSILENGKLLFSNAKHCCSDIMDAIEYYTSSDANGSKAFLSKRLSSKYSICSMWN